MMKRNTFYDWTFISGKLNIYPHLFFQLISDSCFDLSTLAGIFIWPRQRRHLYNFEVVYGPLLTFLKPLKYIALILFLLLLLCLRITIIFGLAASVTSFYKKYSCSSLRNPTSPLHRPYVWRPNIKQLTAPYERSTIVVYSANFSSFHIYFLL